jgi:hypothetical protein
MFIFWVGQVGVILGILFAFFKWNNSRILIWFCIFNLNK